MLSQSNSSFFSMLHLDVHHSLHIGKKPWHLIQKVQLVQRLAALAERLPFLFFCSGNWLLSTWLPYSLWNTDMPAARALRP